MPECSFHGCGRPSVARSLCASHYRQQRRGDELRPLRGPRGQLGDEPLRPVTLRVSQRCADAVSADRAGAREALERWSK